MYHKCSWCKAIIESKPLYYTKKFLQLEPGFEVFCGAKCSLSAYQNSTNILKDQNPGQKNTKK